MKEKSTVLKDFSSSLISNIMRFQEKIFQGLELENSIFKEVRFNDLLKPLIDYEDLSFNSYKENKALMDNNDKISVPPLSFYTYSPLTIFPSDPNSGSLFWSNIGDLFKIFLSESSFVRRLVEPDKYYTKKAKVDDINMKTIEAVKKDKPLTNKDKDVIDISSFDNDEIKIIASSESDYITGKYNAEAITIGNNIFLARDKFNLSTPIGLALLFHELTHVKQMNERFEKGDKTIVKNPELIPSSILNSWEQEAAQIEGNILNYFINPYVNVNNNFLDSNQNNPRSDLQNNRRYEEENYIEDMHFFNNNTTRDIVEYQNLDPILNLMKEYGLNKNNFIFTNLNYKDKNLSDIPSFQQSASSSMGYPSTNEYNINTINENIVYNTNVQNEGSIKNVNVSEPISHPRSTISPLFAKKGRNIISRFPNNDSAQTQILQNEKDNQQTQSPVKQSQLSNIDFEILAEKIYQIIEQKIKIQKTRSGVR